MKVWGWLTPSVTGDYTFWIASDDDSGLWISDSANPIVPTVGSEICRVSKWTGYRN
ncbi:MAG: hypothetical protein GX455_14075 [Phycisphaerae bacterium]|nr:hypothetical protein [Phycisphaerae bacterium]